jgi:post-segregation antitoxin (ccd killing protein)
MATKLTITVPDELAKRLEPHREHMNISRVCAEALEADLKSREAHLASLTRYEESKKMRSEIEAIREQMIAQAGRGWQKLAQDMQRMLKDIGHEIEQLEKQIPEDLRSATVTEPELPVSEPTAEKLAQLLEPEPAEEKPAQSPAPKSVLKRALKLHDPEPAVAN